jgi:hypothetical protein
MAVGLATVATANAWLNTLRGTTFATTVTPFVQAHTADPGSAGTTSVSTGVATRQALSFAAASGGSMSLSSSPSWTATGADTITHISVWGASTAGTWYANAALTASKTVANGDTLTLSTFTISLTPVA